MSKTHKQPKSKSRSSGAAVKDAAKQQQVARKRAKAHSRISKSQAADVTEQINGEFAQLRNFYVRPEARQPDVPSVSENSVQDLADVIRGL
ncbi:hypothetical protein ONZ51_g9511 [Trametes cubensis]|uniref:Uncharacterized protein n=1 Tax=Trametes cubensis TaxID=1111947 RepID=A0AAD7X788_9APHY|nr:hypothetical protein ONZ51_g9511 [Trametes cubensis]